MTCAIIHWPGFIWNVGKFERLNVQTPVNTWRLLLTSPARGAWNMAVDEALLEAIGYSATGI
ncbi:MAG: hypothetical protein KKC71_00995 [Chloroflexi bacterium]|nr:hypothetical protein [Chloroflexota bacterium]